MNKTVNLPASKSISNRALILNELSYSPYDIQNLSESDDTQVLENVLNSNGNKFDVGAAGTSMRFLTAFLAKTVGEWQITGSERMQQRPIKILVEAINQLGGKISYLKNEGFPPLKILGCGLKGGTIQLDGTVSSQYISALMMIAPYMIDGLTIELISKTISKPYIDMTQAMMQDYGVKVYCKENSINIPPQEYKPTPYSVEADWSAASYWYEILALKQSGTIQLSNLKKDSLQGDKVVADIFKYFSIKTTFTQQGVEISYDTTHRPTEDVLKYDFSNSPDLAQTVVVTACMLGIPFVFSGLQTLRIKETDRISALQTELLKLGFVLQEQDNAQLVWDGKKCKAEKKPTISTYQDHRMAMSFAPVGLIVPITIENPTVVTKSYPYFWEDTNLKY